MKKNFHVWLYDELESEFIDMDDILYIEHVPTDFLNNYNLIYSITINLYYDRLGIAVTDLHLVSANKKLKRGNN